MLTATPGSEKVPVDGTCFQSVEVTSKTLESGDVEVTLHLGLPTSLLCHASFILATDKHIELKEVSPPNPIKSIKLHFSSGFPGTTPLLFQPLPVRPLLRIALGDRYRKFYRTLNNAKKPFNSIINFKKIKPHSFKILFI